MLMLAVIFLAVYAGGVAVDTVIIFEKAATAHYEVDWPLFAVCFFWPIFAGARIFSFLCDALEKEAEWIRSKG